MRMSVCIPTYNEAANLPLVTDAVWQALPQAQILVIDDASPDGTGRIADEIARRDRRLSVLHRSGKDGLGRAYIDGFRKVLEEDDADVIVQMDADLSHPPERLGALIAACGEADLAIGSRYVKGGDTSNWGLHRRLISRFGSLYAGVCLGLGVRDVTGGFKAWKRGMLACVIEHQIAARGYAFQVETTYIASRLEARIQEVPIIFTDRDVGASKMSLGIALEAFWQVPLLRFRHRGVRRSNTS